jgi:hypothetical protein
MLPSSKPFDGAIEGYTAIALVLWQYLKLAANKLKEVD